MTPYVRQILDQSLVRPVNDFLSCHGKRIRGSLLQLSYELAGGNGVINQNVCESIERLHAGSLVIDDIQDNSQSRRGQPTMHQRIGIPLAINAGNWLYFQSLELLLNVPLPESAKEKLLGTMIRAARQCHEGQAIDLQARIDNTPTEHWQETIQAISTLKTGTLVGLAVEMGCLTADPQSPLAIVLPKFGKQMGIALQMRNDLDELASIARCTDDRGLSKPIRDDDLRNARLTWPWIWTLELAGQSRCQSLMKMVVRSRPERFEAAAELFDIVGEHGNQAIQNNIRELLRLLAEHVVDRRKLDRLEEILQPIESSYVTTAVSPSYESATAPATTQ
jgi:geranylgeranyl pyrophosphate synthase